MGGSGLLGCDEGKLVGVGGLLGDPGWMRAGEGGILGDQRKRGDRVVPNAPRG